MGEGTDPFRTEPAALGSGGQLRDRLQSGSVIHTLAIAHLGKQVVAQPLGLDRPCRGERTLRIGVHPMVPDLDERFLTQEDIVQLRGPGGLVQRVGPEVQAEEDFNACLLQHAVILQCCDVLPGSLLVGLCPNRENGTQSALFVLRRGKAAHGGKRCRVIQFGPACEEAVQQPPFHVRKRIAQKVAQTQGQFLQAHLREGGEGLRPVLRRQQGEPGFRGAVRQ